MTPARSMVSPRSRCLACLVRVVPTVGVALVLAGCAVGPDFQRPPAPDVERYTSGDAPVDLTAEADGTGQHVTLGQAVSAEWWGLFHSPALDQVLHQAIAGNPTLAAAEATLAQAQQAVRQARAAFYPQLDFGASIDRQESLASASTGSGGTNLYSLGPTVSYAPDVFGGTRRQVEQQAALAEKQGYQLAAAYLTLTGNAVAQAINLASARMQLSTVESILADDEQNLDLVRQTLEAGKATQLDVLTAESLLANDRTLVPPLRQQVSTARHALSILVGKFPGDWSPPDFDLADFTLPGDLPVSLPSELAHQRPDILAAEAQLHADSAAVGVATAQMFPSITLSAAVSAEALSTSGVFPGASMVWNLAAGLTTPLFHGGALAAQRKGAIAAFQAALATYQATVLQAFGQVADTLRALEHDAELVDAERRALDSSTATLELQRFSYTAGKSNLLDLLVAERLSQQAQLGYARARAQRYQDTTLLLVAMGGGWCVETADPAFRDEFCRR
jgi:NodT family efflux transporter outer membrane factor (OMF) lipoprotein